MQQDLKQGTPEWLDWRRKHITASDAPVLMQVSKWTTPYQLFLNKAGLGESKPVSESMRRGLEIEPIALMEVEALLNTQLAPAVLQHPGIAWMGASLDGYNAKEGRVIEIKLANVDDHECASSGNVPVHYYPQLQHQMLVAGVSRMYYYSYRPNGSVLLEVKRDNDYCNRLLDTEFKFWDRLQACEAPEMTDKDYFRQDSDEWIYLAKMAIETQNCIKMQEAVLEECKTALERLAEGKSCVGGGIKFAKTTRRGVIDYKAIPELEKVNLEHYRKAPSTFYRLMKDG